MYKYTVSDTCFSYVVSEICAALCFSYVVSEILSGVQRETIVDNIHSELIRIAALANDGKDLAHNVAETQRSAALQTGSRSQRS